jgi:hypothetical protein
MPTAISLEKLLGLDTPTKLTKMCFGLQTDPKKTPFGLLNGQIKHNAIITSAGWYNFGGQKLGYGDLSLSDMAKISKNISGKDIFFVLSEGDSFWNIPKGANSSEPGTKYVIENASWVITNSLIVRSRPDIKKAEKISQDGIEYVRIPRSNVKEVLTPPPIQDKKEDYGDIAPPLPPPKKKLRAKSIPTKAVKLPGPGLIPPPLIVAPLPTP